jgi:hypothetical protein
MPEDALMSNPARFEVFRTSITLSTLAAVQDPRQVEGWAESDEAEQAFALEVYENAPKGKIQYFSSTITDVTDENSPISKTLQSEFFNKDTSDGSEELAEMLHNASAFTLGRYEMIAPVQKTLKRLIQWEADLRALN